MRGRGEPRFDDLAVGIPATGQANVLAGQREAARASALQPVDRIQPLRRLVREVVTLGHVEAVRARNRVEHGIAAQLDQPLLAAHAVDGAEERGLERRELAGGRERSGPCRRRGEPAGGKAGGLGRGDGRAQQPDGDPEADDEAGGLGGRARHGPTGPPATRLAARAAPACRRCSTSARRSCRRRSCPRRPRSGCPWRRTA